MNLLRAALNKCILSILCFPFTYYFDMPLSASARDWPTSNRQLRTSRGRTFQLELANFLFLRKMRILNLTMMGKFEGR